MEPARSRKWPAVERAHRRLEPYCVACPPSRAGRKIAQFFRLHRVQVHHIIPFHYCVALGRPDLELDHRNLVTLCSTGKNHHLTLGHLDDFRVFNPAVRDWLAGKKTLVEKPKPLAAMTEDDKAAFRAMMSARYPGRIVEP